MFNFENKNAENNIYRPRYGRFKVNLAFAYEQRRWYGKKQSGISNKELFFRKLGCYLSCCVDKYAKEEFDFFIAGNDPLIALLIGIKLGNKGYRVLIHPSYPENDSVELNKLIESQSMLRNDELISLVSESLGERTLFSNLQELLIHLCSKISEIKDANNESSIMISNGTRILTGSDWTSLFNKKQQIWPVGNDLLPGKGAWPIIRPYLTKYTPHESIPGYGKNKEPDYCITTINHQVLTTRTDHGIYSELNSIAVTKLGDAAFNVEHHESYSINDRMNEITSALNWVDSINNKDQINV